MTETIETTEKTDNHRWRVLTARVAHARVEPHTNSLRPFSVEAPEMTEAVRRGCEAAVRAGLMIKGDAGLPLDVHVLELELYYSEPPRGRYVARLDFRSSGKTLCFAAGEVQRLS